MVPAKVEIYTVDWCGYCRAAERLLTQKGAAFIKTDVTHDRAKRAWLAEVTGQPTVPQIFINGRSVGGYSDISALDRRGALDPLLQGQDPMA